MPPTRPGDRAAAAARRDAGLMRVSRLTRWLLAGALALTAVFSTVAARVSGATANHKAATSPSQSSGSDSGATEGSGSGSTQGSGSTDSGSNLQAPGSLPFSSGGSGNVTSGGS